jgi:hypothetical protein
MQLSSVVELIPITGKNFLHLSFNILLNYLFTSKSSDPIYVGSGDNDGNQYVGAIYTSQQKNGLYIYDLSAEYKKSSGKYLSLSSCNCQWISAVNFDQASAVKVDRYYVARIKVGEKFDANWDTLYRIHTIGTFYDQTLYYVFWGTSKQAYEKVFFLMEILIFAFHLSFTKKVKEK